MDASIIKIMNASDAPIFREPITASRREVVVEYRTFAARYRGMAGIEERPSVRDGLLDLARRFEIAATERERDAPA